MAGAVGDSLLATALRVYGGPLPPDARAALLSAAALDLTHKRIPVRPLSFFLSLSHSLTHFHEDTGSDSDVQGAQEMGPRSGLQHLGLQRLGLQRLGLHAPPP